MAEADWYFDFISPFSYLQSELLDRLPDGLQIAYRPVLFAGLLDHWGHKGPAEIPGKRVYTFRFCKWWADRHGIAFTMPPAHPFNPLNVLRLAVALDVEPAAVRRIFRFIWKDGRRTDTEDGWRDLTAALAIADADARIADPAVKDGLRANGLRAIEQGVFGVPTFVVGGEIFWGVEATDMLLDFLDNPALFATGEMARLSALPTAAQRRTS